MKSLGYLKDEEDTRDLLMGVGEHVTPGFSDLSSFVREVFDQLNTNSCVLNAMSSGDAIRSVVRGRPWEPFSRSYPYYYARLALLGFGRASDGTLLDAGCRPRDALRALTRLGAPSEKHWKFSEEDINRRPTHKVRRLAVDKKFSYQRCRTVRDIGRSLELKCPVVVGLNIDEEFRDHRVQEVVRSFDSERVGGHMMLAVGFDPQASTVKLLNSWGDDWRHGGYCEIDADLLAKEMMDTWSIQ